MPPPPCSPDCSTPRWWVQLCSSSYRAQVIALDNFGAVVRCRDRLCKGLSIRRAVDHCASCLPPTHLILLYWRRLARCSSTSATVTPPPRCTASPGPELAEAVGDTQLQVLYVSRHRRNHNLILSCISKIYCRNRYKTKVQLSGGHDIMITTR